MKTEQQEMSPLFLARIGKKIIRPGGMEMINELLQQCDYCRIIHFGMWRRTQQKS